MNTVYTISSGQLRHVITEHVADILTETYAAWARSTYTANTYEQNWGFQMPRGNRLRSKIAHIRQMLASYPPEFTAGNRVVRKCAEILDFVDNLAPPRLFDCYRELVASTKAPTDSVTFPEVQVKLEGNYVKIEIPSDDHTNSTDGFLSQLGRIVLEARENAWDFDVNTDIALHVGFHLLATGHRMPVIGKGWGTSGFRTHQTNMSITDPGQGHLHGTLTSKDLLDGVVVHIEHLERGVNISRLAIEPYRIVDPIMINHIGFMAQGSAPVTSYVGRPVFEGAVADSMLKTSRTMAAAISEIFSSGLAECKVAIENVTASQAVDLMQYIAGQTRRDPSWQILSAAFNINTPIVDDRAETIQTYGKPKKVTEPIEIARLGIELAISGGFEKVTWDGTADSYPSTCVIEQLGDTNCLRLVHEAHERGLLTYFSAGFRYPQIDRVVLSGVDGVGVGGAQILRYMESITGNHGPFLPNNVPTILSHRDSAEESNEGRAALLLARLDRMFFEGSITPEEDIFRTKLFRTLTEGSPVLSLLASPIAQRILSLSPDDNVPLVCTAERILSSQAPLARERISAESWEQTRSELEQAAAAKDIEELLRLLSIVEFKTPLPQ